MKDQKALIDDPERLRQAAFDKGQIAADRGYDRASPFVSEELTSEFYRGYDQQLQRQKKPWGRKGTTAEPRPKVVSADVQATRDRLRAIKHNST